jgi:flagellar hook-associated protein 3 FlgL
MRIAGTTYSDIAVSQLNLLTAQQTQLQNQVSTGQRVRKPEDDPAAMAKGLSLQAENSAAAQFSRNISMLQNRANTVYGALDQLKTISDRASEIATQADGTASPAELQSFATEVGQLIQQAVSLANTKDGSQYVFAGTNSGQPAFTTTTDANGNVTGVAYQGNTSVMQTQIADGTTMTVDSPGQNATGTGARGVFSDSRYGADFFNHLISLENHLQSGDTTSISSTDAPALAKDEDNIIYQVSANGVAQSRLTTAASIASNRQTSLQTAFSSLTGADLTQTIVDLTQTQNTYQAALESSSALLKMQQSLLQYL